MRQQLLKDRYFAPGETAEQHIYARVANAVAQDDSDLHDTMYDAMVNGVWLPNSPTLANAGVPGRGGLSACYVLPCNDSLDDIYQTVWDAARVHKAFGGTGFNFSHLRTEGTRIASTGGCACGPIKVMKLLNVSADTVRQGGKREGANMGILNATHPDVYKFINCKSDGDLTHFNLSVGMTDSDMKDEELLQAIAERAYTTGDPGIIFLDRLNPNGAVHNLPLMEATNPCGEQPLRPYECCNLGSINLSKFPQIAVGDCADFMKAVRMSIRALDAIIDINTFPIDEITHATTLTRKIGSGIMGWADWLVMNGISYQSPKAIEWAHRIGEMYYNTARDESHKLALQKGNYPAWGADHTSAETRNETLLTIAPTGTLSYLAGCSWGIEPIFDWTTTRESESGTSTSTSAVYEAAKANGLLDDVAHNIDFYQQIRHVAAWQRNVDNGVSKTINLPSSASIDDIIKAFKYAWQLKCKGITVYRDGSKQRQVVKKAVTTTGTSRPTNSRIVEPSQASTELEVVGYRGEYPVVDVRPTGSRVQPARDVQSDNSRTPIEGSTVGRDRPDAGLPADSSGDGRSQPIRKRSLDPSVIDGHNVERYGSTIDYQSGCGRIHITCNERDRNSGCPFEVYILSEGGCPASNEAIGKLISKYVHDPRLSGDERATVARIVKSLKKVDCPTAMRNPKAQGKSCAEIIAKRMAEVWPSEAKPLAAKVQPDPEAKCPQCGAPATFGLGCRSGSCTVCGWSGCS